MCLQLGCSKDWHAVDQDYLGGVHLIKVLFLPGTSPGIQHALDTFLAQRLSIIHTLVHVPIHHVHDLIVATPKAMQKPSVEAATAS